jgi:hypothetical protein
MAWNSSLGNVVTMLKAELAANQIVGTAAANDTQYACLIAAKQRWLSDTYDWPELEYTWDVQVPGGGQGRYNTFPTTTGLNTTRSINYGRPLHTSVWYSGNWQTVVYGINEMEFNYINSDGAIPDTGMSPQILDPIQRWREASTTQFEVWPVPSVNQVFRFRAQSELTPLLEFSPNVGQPSTISPMWTATLDLDDVMVMLYTAGELLQLRGKGNAQALMQRAQARMAQIRATYPKRTMDCAFGQSRTHQYSHIVAVKTPILVAGGKP